MSKRRSRSESPPVYLQQTTAAPAHAQLYIQAHEATLIQHQTPLASLVEQHGGKGGRMLQWRDEDDQVEWIDRYDVLNLLTSLPTFLSPPSPATTTETRGQQEEEDERGFTDLGSDSEELFYFIPSERATIARQKKRIKLEYAREERLKAKEREEKSTVESVEGADMEPSPAQQTLMTHLLSTTFRTASDPALLEIKILAHHGATDERFLFLRKGGRGHVEWERMKRTGVGSLVVETEKVETAGGGGLVEYGSDSEEEEEEEKVIPAVTLESIAETEERVKKERKAAKVREWSEKRRKERGEI